jgi:regulator of sigma E protease
VNALTSLGQSVITVVVFLAMLAILVIVHELGHFVVARLAGVRVLEFGVGFPPRARVLRSEGETLYTLNWLPIGGFVKLEGEDGDSDDPRSFVSAALPVKLIILVAGVAMNLVLAFAIFASIGWLPGNIGAIGFQTVQPGSPAEQAGLQGSGPEPGKTGDLIVAVDGVRYHDFDPGQLVLEALRRNAGETVTLTVLRPSGAIQDVTVTLRRPEQLGETQGPLGVEKVTFQPTPLTFTRSPLAALGYGADRTRDALGLIVGGLGELGDAIVSRPTEAPPVQGPVGIAVGVGDVFWQQGPVATLFLAGLLSANLALVNILPLPPLDGGRMLVLLIKAVVGKRLSIQAERLTYVIGFGFLMAFLAWITFFDIARQVGGGQ